MLKQTQKTIVPSFTSCMLALLAYIDTTKSTGFKSCFFLFGRGGQFGFGGVFERFVVFCFLFGFPFLRLIGCHKRYLNF